MCLCDSQSARKNIVVLPGALLMICLQVAKNVVCYIGQMYR